MTKGFKPARSESNSGSLPRSILVGGLIFCAVGWGAWSESFNAATTKIEPKIEVERIEPPVVFTSVDTTGSTKLPQTKSLSKSAGSRSLASVPNARDENVGVFHYESYEGAPQDAYVRWSQTVSPWRAKNRAIQGIDQGLRARLKPSKKTTQNRRAIERRRRFREAAYQFSGGAGQGMTPRQSALFAFAMMANSSSKGADVVAVLKPGSGSGSGSGSGTPVLDPCETQALVFVATGSVRGIETDPRCWVGGTPSDADAQNILSQIPSSAGCGDASIECADGQEWSDLVDGFVATYPKVREQSL